MVSPPLANPQDQSATDALASSEICASRVESANSAPVMRRSWIPTRSRSDPRQGQSGACYEATRFKRKALRHNGCAQHHHRSDAAEKASQAPRTESVHLGAVARSLRQAFHLHAVQPVMIKICEACGRRSDTPAHRKYCRPKNLYCDCGNLATNWRKWRDGICQRCVDIEMENDRTSMQINAETKDQPTTYAVRLPRKNL